MGSVTATEVNLAPGRALSCTLSGDTLQRKNASDTIGYNAYFGDDATDKTISLAQGAVNVVKVAIDADKITAAPAGSYTGALTFTFNVK